MSLITEAISQGARQFKACEILGISCRTLRRWQSSESLADQRKGARRMPSSQMLSSAEKKRIIDVCNSSDYQSLPPSQIVPKLADKGVYIASESSFYRVLREHEQVNRRGHAKTSRVLEKPLPLIATGPRQVWSWDITYLPTDVKGQFFRLYMVIDVYSRLIVGWEVHLNESAELAGQLMEKACLRHKISRDQLVLHSDNGSPMKGATMLATLQKLGIMPSFSRPSVSDDNPYSESLFRTLKYTPAYPKSRFKSIDKAREWVLRFVTWYNNEHHHSGIKFVTPAQRHEGKDQQILRARTAVYEAAKETHPDRWRGRAVRNWEYNNEVSLNPNKAQKEVSEMKTLAA